MNKWFMRTFLAVIALITIVVSTSFFLLGTESGTRWLVERLENVTDNAFTVSELKGDLLGQLSMRQVSYQTAGMKVAIESVQLVWEPQALLGGVFHLASLQVSGLDFEQLQIADTSEATQPLEIVDIELPLDIVVDNVEITKVKLVTAPAADPVLIDRLYMQAIWNDEGLTLKTLQLAMPELVASGSGSLLPRGNYPVEIITSIEIAGVELPAIQVDGNISGDLQALVIKQQVTGDVNAVLNAQVKDVLLNLNWTVALAVTGLPETMLPASAQQDLIMDVKAVGDKKKATADLELQIGGSDGNGLALNVDVQFDTLQFQINGIWKKLQWPLVGAPAILAADGKLGVTGTPDDYQITLTSAARGDGLPVSQWTMAAKGNSEQLTLESLYGALLGGSIEMQADVTWLPQLAWDARLVAKSINPGVLNADWPGDINFTTITEGKIADDQLYVQVELAQLDGTLRERPLAGGGSIRMAGPDISIASLNLGSGDARFSIDGDINDSMNVKWQLQVPSLADLLVDASGTLRVEGTISGTTALPVVAGELSASALMAGTMELESASSDFLLSMDTTQSSKLVVQVSNLDLNGQLLSHMGLNIEGPVNSHDIQLEVKHEQLDVTFSGQGGYFEDSATWQGEVLQLALLSKELGDWKLQEKAQLGVAAASITLSPLCLQNGSTGLCSEVDWAGKEGTAQIKLHDFDLDRIKPFLPAELVDLKGVLGFDLELESAQQLQATLAVDLQPGSFVVQAGPDNQVRMAHKNGRINVRYDDQELRADWNFDFGEHNAQGEINVAREALGLDPLQAPLVGQIKVSAPDLLLIKAFIPQIEDISGDFQADLQLGGLLGSPHINGQAMLRSSRVVIPLLGLDMSDLLVKASSDGGDSLELTAAVASGGGTLNMEGQVSLDAEQRWPAKLMVVADRFQAANLPEAQLTFSTDISLERKNAINIIRGSVSIPKANIEIKEIPEGSQSASADVIIVSEYGEQQDLPPDNLDLELSLTLGDKVHFGGMGLKADLRGEITAIVRPGKLPTANGDISVRKGSFRAYGQNLTIEKGRISYAGGYLDNPGVQMRASRTIDSIKVGVDVAGTAKKLELNVFSDDPDISDSDAISMMLTGQKLSDVNNAQIYAGKQITPDLSVGVNFGAGDAETEFVARYRLRENIQAEGTSSSKKSGASILYTIDVE